VNKKVIIIPIIVVVIGFFAAMSLDSSEKDDDVVFHVTLADPQLYENGIYSDSFLISKGEYYFRFVPNGSSPETLSISLNGAELDFSEDFKLENTLHQTGISEYYTWEYLGQKEVTVSENQQVIIIINPNGNVMGSVSVDILQN
jgi:sulfur carrier protein ThiS